MLFMIWVVSECNVAAFCSSVLAEEGWKKKGACLWLCQLFRHNNRHRNELLKVWDALL